MIIRLKSNVAKVCSKEDIQTVKNNIKCCHGLTNIRNSRQRHRKAQTNSQKKIIKITSNVAIGLQILEIVDKGIEKHRQIFRKN